MSSIIGAYREIFSDADEGVKIMARKPTKQKGGAETPPTNKAATQANIVNTTTQGNVTNITTWGNTKTSSSTTQPNRKAKFYDDILNCRLRELMDTREAKTEELANAVSIGSSGVRMWYTGYARPDIDKIPAICKFYEVSADWLLGISDTRAVDIEMRDICEKTGRPV